MKEEAIMPLTGIIGMLVAGTDVTGKPVEGVILDKILMPVQMEVAASSFEIGKKQALMMLVIHIYVVEVKTENKLENVIRFIKPDCIDTIY